MEYEQAKKMVDDDGWDGFFEHFNEEYEERDLFGCSQDWYKDETYICKFKGGKGDVVIGWKGVHDK